jgi:hypothetical protein
MVSSIGWPVVLQASQDRPEESTNHPHPHPLASLKQKSFPTRRDSCPAATHTTKTVVFLFFSGNFKWHSSTISHSSVIGTFQVESNGKCPTQAIGFSGKEEKKKKIW